jgi:hypothetical protein
VTNLKTDPNNASYDEHDDIMYTSAIPFVLVHLACIAAIWTGITWLAVAICVVLYWLRIFAIGAGYHRYFSHRAYSTSRASQFVIAALAQSTMSRPRRSVRRCKVATTTGRVPTARRPGSSVAKPAKGAPTCSQIASASPLQLKRQDLGGEQPQQRASISDWPTYFCV